MESEAYEMKLKFDWESETKRSNALYKSRRLEKHERFKHKYVPYYC